MKSLEEIQQNIENKKIMHINAGGLDHSELKRISHLVSHIDHTQENLSKEIRLKIENINIDFLNLKSELNSFKSISFFQRLKWILFGN